MLTFAGNRLRLMILFGLCWMVSAAYAADPYSEQWGPALGSQIPVLEAPDQDGVMRDFEDLAGQHGLLLFFNRSTDW